MMVLFCQLTTVVQGNTLDPVLFLVSVIMFQSSIYKDNNIVSFAKDTIHFEVGSLG